ncbi:MAG: TerB family tellurite resistance protein [Gammaproteobacteria bacterium]|nr:MAG: TerB family tellurite resistance protein [Gammaproteobacteria bacterium]
MIGKLKNILMGDKAFSANAENQEDRQQLALASLLVEMARADFDETHDEHSLIIDLLASHYDLSAAEAQELLNKARAANDKAVCLFDFTRALHQSLDEEQKKDVIRLLWQVANADDKLDKYEDFLVRKVADLLYVPHSDVIRLKHEVM